MPWGRTFDLQKLKTDINMAFNAMYGRDLVIDERELDKYLKVTCFKDECAVLAHVKRVLAYYKAKYEFVPRFSHIVSSKMPKTERTSKDWEAELYSKFPTFQPLYHTRDIVKAMKTTNVGSLFSRDRAEFFHGFAVAVLNHPDPVYLTRSLMLIEKAIFSIGRNPEWAKRLPLAPVVEAHTRLRKMEVPHRTDHKIWRQVHFSKTLVRKNTMKVFGYGFSFWELPKILVDHAFAESALNCRVTPAHLRAVKVMVEEYGYRYRLYLPYLLNVRPPYVLRHRMDIVKWESELSPSFVPDYPFTK